MKLLAAVACVAHALVQSVTAHASELCESEQSFLAGQGVAIGVLDAHVVYPMTVQSQSCTGPNRLTEAEYNAILLNYVVALGCGERTRAYETIAPQLATRMESGFLDGRTTEGIPDRYLSVDPDFCFSDALITMNRCAADATTCLPDEADD